MAPWLAECLFADDTCAAAYAALSTSATFADALATAEPDAVELLQRLAVEEPFEQPEEVAVRLVVTAARRAIEDVADATEQRTRLQQLHEAQSDASTRLDAAEQLLAWLVSRSQVRG
jgi:hypothetical protein